MKRSGPLQRKTELKRVPFARIGKAITGPLSRLKPSRPKTTPIRQSARDEECTLRLPGVCNYRTDTTVLCHSNDYRDGKGLGLKSSDLAACYGCSECHRAVDGQSPLPAGMTREMMLERFEQAIIATHDRLKAKGLLKEVITRVHMLEAVERLPGSKYRCKCDCGNERVVLVGHFNTGTIKSCGCHHWHGHAGEKTREYTTYHNMVARCHKPTNKRYADYGARGIFVCDRWLESFQNFIDDMGECPDGYQIDRIDNSAGYSPENCRWVSPKENMANRSVTNIWTVYGKPYKAAIDAAHEYKVSTSTIRAWCMGRVAKGRRYPAKPNCSVRPLADGGEN